MLVTLLRAAALCSDAKPDPPTPDRLSWAQLEGLRDADRFDRDVGAEAVGQLRIISAACSGRGGDTVSAPNCLAASSRLGQVDGDDLRWGCTAAVEMAASPIGPAPTTPPCRRAAPGR